MSYINNILDLDRLCSQRTPLPKFDLACCVAEKPWFGGFCVRKSVCNRLKKGCSIFWTVIQIHHGFVSAYSKNEESCFSRYGTVDDSNSDAKEQRRTWRLGVRGED